MKRKWKHILLSVCMTGALVWGQEGEKLLTSAESSIQERQEKETSQKKVKKSKKNAELELDMDMSLEPESEMDLKIDLELEPETETDQGMDLELESGTETDLEMNLDPDSEAETDLELESETELESELQEEFEEIPADTEPEENESGETEGEEPEMAETEPVTEESEAMETEETERETAEPEEIEAEFTESENLERETESEETEIQESEEIEEIETETLASAEAIEESEPTTKEKQTELLLEPEPETEYKEPELKEIESTESDESFSPKEIQEIELKIEEIQDEEILKEPEESAEIESETKAAEPEEVQQPETEGAFQTEQKPEDSAESEPMLQPELKEQKKEELPVHGTYTQGRKWTIVEVPEMEEQEELDDGDQLTATIKGQDASWNSQNCVYGVNQYGSVFHADDKTQKKQEAFYLKESFEPVMELENVKEIQTQKLVCIKNGVSRELTAGVDYETCEVEKENGWKKYAYRIKKETFQEEGIYSVTIFTMDQAGNISDTRKSADTLSFVIDRTPPEVRLEGIADGRTYQKGKCQAGILAGDSSGIRHLEVWADGKLLSQGDTDSLEVQLDQTGWHTIWAKAWDNAGNVACSEKIRYCIAGETSGQVQKTVFKGNQPKVMQTGYEKESKLISSEIMQTDWKKKPEKLTVVLMSSLFLLVMAVCLLRKLEF